MRRENRESEDMTTDPALDDTGPDADPDVIDDTQRSDHPDRVKEVVDELNRRLDADPMAAIEDLHQTLLLVSDQIARIFKVLEDDTRLQCLEEIILTLAGNATIPPGNTRTRVRELRARLQERSDD